MNDIRLDITKLIWFHQDRPTGEAGCFCSSCKQLIAKNNVAIQLVCGPCMKQLRFHIDCYFKWFVDPVVGVM